MTYRAFRVSYFPEKRGEVWVDEITECALAKALGLDPDQLYFADMKIGNRRFIAVTRKHRGIPYKDVPVTAISFDPLGVAVIEARGDFLVLHAKGIDPSVDVECLDRDVRELVRDEVNYLRGKFVHVPNVRVKDITALEVEWLA